MKQKLNANNIKIWKFYNKDLIIKQRLSIMNICLVFNMSSYNQKIIFTQE
jgi:hypothetical protein